MNKELKDSFFNDINGHSLDISQRKAILDESDSLLVVAGAGSGKTLTIIGKIKYLIEKKGIKPEEILCISFTNETVNSLMEKLDYPVKVQTFHKLALSILNENDIKYQIVSDDELDFIVEEYFENENFNNRYKQAILDYFNYENNKTFTYRDITKFREFQEYKKDIITFIKRIECYNHKLEDIKMYFIENQKYKDPLRRVNYCFMLIALDIYNIYLKEIQSYKGIDFDQMISYAIDLVKKNGINTKYKHIIVDEFQDTSFVRYNLLKEIVIQTGAKVFCVGDDYQSIYAFSGCNIDLFIKFREYFKNANIRFITKTYRNSYELVNITSRFILKNKFQLKKNIKANFTLRRPIKIVYYRKSIYKQMFKKVLDYIIDSGETKILVLGRNNDDIKNVVAISGNFFIYRGIKIKYLSVHKSKGLEEDNVIILNCSDSISGFPNKMKYNKIFNFIGKSNDNYEYSEERRLFYVALTRARKYVYIMAPYSNESIFVKEIKNRVQVLTIK